MKFILVIFALYLTMQYLDYQVRTKDKSIQGFIEYMKQKYYNKD